MGADGEDVALPLPDNGDGIILLGGYLVRRGLAEEKAGYGHATGEKVAEALLADFIITPRVGSQDGGT